MRGRIKEYVPEDGTLVIPRGGFFADAELGVCLLAEELAAWMVENQIASEVAVVLPSGTGSTAYYLAKSLAALENTGKIPKTMVYTVSVAVSSEVLASDIKKLGKLATCESESNLIDSGGTELDSLVILDTQKKYRFGKPYPEFLVIYNTFREQQNIEFDLIYSPKTWKAIFENWKLFNDKLLVVVHTGGVTGNSSQLERYSRSSETKD